MKSSDQIQCRAASLIDKARAVIATERPDAHNLAGFPTLEEQAYANWRSQSLAFLTDLLGPDHVYTNSFTTNTESSGYVSSVRTGMGVLQAVLEDIEQGFIETIRRLIAAEVFAGLFDQATHLLQKGYNAPAASLAGAVLEDGLRTIAVGKGVQLRGRTSLSSLNQKLAEKGVYSRLMQKKVSLWTDIRNAADHGHFDQLNTNDIRDFINGAESLLSDFL